MPLDGDPGRGPALSGSEDRLESLFEGFRQFTNPLLLIDGEGHILRANPAAYRLLLPATAEDDEDAPRSLAAHFEHYLKDDPDARRSLRATPLESALSVTVTSEDGRRLTVDLLQRPMVLRGQHLRLLHLVSAAQKARAAPPLPYLVALEAVRDGVLFAGSDGRIDYVNAAAERLLGRRRTELHREPMASLMTATGNRDEALELFREFQDRGHWETIIHGATGAAGPRHLSLEMTRNPPIGASVPEQDTPVTYVATLRDVDPVIDERQRLLSLAETDSLTQIANRMGFMRVLERSFATAKRQGRELVVLYIDLDNFKFLNDSYGHKYGDTLLIAFARRLEASVKAGDLVARLGGDEFVILFHGEGELASGIEGTVERLRKRLLQPYALMDIEFACSASFGSARYPGDAVDCDELLSFADQAMFMAKQMGRDAFCAFDSSTVRDNWRKARRVAAIADGIDRGDFVPFYQPQYDTFSGRLVGAEALARWVDRSSGEVLALPGDFLPAISRHPRLIQLGISMIRQVLADQRAFRDLHKPVPISVNLSPMQLRAEETICYLENSAREQPALTRHLWLEVTEHAFFKRDPEILRNMQRIEGAGMPLVLDDFGTGHSSIFSLRANPFRLIKIDRSFLDAVLHGDAGDRVVLNSIIELIKALNLQVLCEGVENERQLDYLRERDCDYCQGYFYARPMPAKEFRDLLQHAA